MARARIVKVSVLAATAALLAGCSWHPGAAAVVDGATISDARVDEVATAICSANSGSAAAGQSQGLASRGARQAALQVLLDATLSRQFGLARGIAANPATVSAALARSAGTIDALPPSERAAFRSALSDFAAGQYIVIDAGRQYLATHGMPNATDTQAAAAGRRLRGQFAKHVTIQVDPRYGAFNLGSGSLGAGGGSLSVPASTFALDGASPDPSAGWVAGLPAGQKCS
ncbi:MAG: hypothetical protein ACXVW6_12375 [Nocardioidaceae bacterium]